MLNLTLYTTKDPREVRDRLDDVFGPGGLGLNNDSYGDTASYTGGGGFVTATVRKQDGQTVIDLQTQESRKSSSALRARLHNLRTQRGLRLLATRPAPARIRPAPRSIYSA